MKKNSHSKILKEEPKSLAYQYNVLFYFDV